MKDAFEPVLSRNNVAAVVEPRAVDGEGRPASEAPLGTSDARQADARGQGGDLLRAERVRVEFDGFLALADVSLTLRAGELLGLVGPNGAGKTTLLRVLAGLQPTVAGAVFVLGERLAAGDAGMRHIGFTADEPPHYPTMTVRQFLRFIARGYGQTGSSVDEKIDFWLEQVWLTEKADQKLSTLSRGMRQRLGIARTMLPNPPVVLLDEPAAGLDPAGRAQFRRLLMSLRQQGKSLIVSSHILSDLAEYCSHVAIMAFGQVVRHGTVREIAEADASTAVYAVGVAAAEMPAATAGPGGGAEGEPGRWAEAAGSVAGVTQVEVMGRKLLVHGPAGSEGAAEVLRGLIAAGVPVCSFDEEGGGLEQAYLRSGVGQVD